ncbi:hypothetical protein ACSBR2_040054 [Camellia fascicularis]
MASQFVLSLGLLAITCSVAFASDNSHLQDFCIAGNTSNAVGSKVTVVNVAQFSGLNTFGISMAHVDYASLGINPPRIHPRATEILIAIEGSLQPFSALSSQNAGIITIANTVFGSKPTISSDLPSKAFQVDKNLGSAGAAADAGTVISISQQQSQSHKLHQQQLRLYHQQQLKPHQQQLQLLLAQLTHSRDRFSTCSISLYNCVTVSPY